MKFTWNGASGYNPSLGNVIEGQTINFLHAPTDKKIKRMISSGLLKKQPGKPKPEAPQKTTVEEVK